MQRNINDHDSRKRSKVRRIMMFRMKKNKVSKELLRKNFLIIVVHFLKFKLTGFYVSVTENTKMIHMKSLPSEVPRIAGKLYK